MKVSLLDDFNIGDGFVDVEFTLKKNKNYIHNENDVGGGYPYKMKLKNRHVETGQCVADIRSGVTEEFLIALKEDIEKLLQK